MSCIDFMLRFSALSKQQKGFRAVFRTVGQMVKINSFLITLMVVTTLSGCSSTPNRAYVEPVDPVVSRISQLAESISKSASALAEIERAKYSRENNIGDVPVDYERVPVMQRTLPLNADYHGLLMPLIKSISLAANMNQPRVLGVAPSNGILISVPAGNRTIFDNLYDIGGQTGTRAHIEYKAAENLLQVEYMVFR